MLRGIMALLLVPVIIMAAEVTSLDFKVGGDGSVLEINSDGPLVYTENSNPQDSQVVLDLGDATLGSNAARKLDTSSFNSPVSLVSPYSEGGQTRVVIQMKEFSTPQISQEGNVIRVRFGAGNSTAETGQPDLPNEDPADPLAPPEDPTTAEEAPPPLEDPSLKPEDKNTSRLKQFAETKETQNFIGKPITLQVRDADVRDVLRLISEASGFNIIVGKDVKGKVTLSLVDVPWDQVLAVVLETLGLGAERNKNVLRVLTITNLTAEKKANLEAKKASEATAPKITRVFPISYAKPEELVKILKTFGKSKTGNDTGEFEVDPRTNSIVVQDISDNVERMRKLIEILDTQTPQVMVEAKIVEAKENFSKTLGGSLGVSFSQGTGPQQFFGSFAGGNPTDTLVGASGVIPGIDFGQRTAQSGELGMSFGLSSGTSKINALINLGQVEGDLKVVSSPKTVVLNKQEASIVQGIPVLVPVATIGNTVTVSNGEEIQQANIGLKVKPTVTNDEGVLLELDISRDVPEPVSTNQTGIGNRNIKTKVLVDNGTTLVIGGIYLMDKTNSSSGFPILKDLPIIGWLFGNRTNSVVRSELFIFVTPRILNVKRAGLRASAT